MSDAEDRVSIVDDDEAVRRALIDFLEACGLRATGFADARSFLGSEAVHRPGCVVLDLKLPDLSGLDVQAELVARNSPLAVILVTGFADVPTAVSSMRAGAVDFIEKPVGPEALVERIRGALRRSADDAAALAAQRDACERIQRLTQREREVCDLVVRGDSNKMIANELGISVRTVDVHRARVMEKTGAPTLSELVRLRLRAGDGVEDSALVGEDTNGSSHQTV